MEYEDYTPLILASIERDRKATEERYGPSLGLFGAIGKLSEWQAKDWEIENFWVDDRAIGWRPKGHPEEGAVVLIP